jgi:hypothetical protein
VTTINLPIATIDNNKLRNNLKPAMVCIQGRDRLYTVYSNYGQSHSKEARYLPCRLLQTHLPTIKPNAWHRPACLSIFQSFSLVVALVAEVFQSSTPLSFSCHDLEEIQTDLFGRCSQMNFQSQQDEI